LGRQTGCYRCLRGRSGGRTSQFLTGVSRQDRWIGGWGGLPLGFCLEALESGSVCTSSSTAVEGGAAVV